MQVFKWISSLWIRVVFVSVCALKVCDMYEWVHGWRRHPLPALSTHLPPALHRRLARAVVHVPVLHGTGRRCAAYDLRNELEPCGIIRAVSVLCPCDAVTSS